MEDLSIEISWANAVRFASREMQYEKDEENGIPPFLMEKSKHLVLQAKEKIDNDPIAQRLLPTAKEYTKRLSQREDIIADQTLITKFSEGLQELSYFHQGLVTSCSYNMNDEDKSEDWNNIQKELLKNPNLLLIDSILSLLFQIKNDVLLLEMPDLMPDLPYKLQK